MIVVLHAACSLLCDVCWLPLLLLDLCSCRRPGVRACVRDESCACVQRVVGVRGWLAVAVLEICCALLCGVVQRDVVCRTVQRCSGVAISLACAERPTWVAFARARAREKRRVSWAGAPARRTFSGTWLSILFRGGTVGWRTVYDRT